MGNWVHTDEVSVAEFVSASLVRAQSARPWSSGDASAFRGVQLLRAITLARMSGSVQANPRSEASPFASMVIAVGGPPPEADRAAAMRVLAATSVILSGGKVDASDIQTFSRGAEEVGIAPVVAAGVVVVSLGAIAFLGYCVHEAVALVDNDRQREADMQKLKVADAQALEIIRRHTDREAQAGKALSLDDASKSALSALAKMQEVLAAKQTTVDPPAPGFWESLSLTEKILGGVVVVGGAYALLKN